MSESLSELVNRRLAEIGRRRGGEPISLHAAWETLPPKQDGTPLVSYETVRRVHRAGHTKIDTDTVDALALMLGVPADDVSMAAGQRVRLGRFTLPRRADKLDKKERKVVVAVIDAIIEAAETKEGQAHGNLPAEKTHGPPLLDVDGEGL